MHRKSPLDPNDRGMWSSDGVLVVVMVRVELLLVEVELVLLVDVEEVVELDIAVIETWNEQHLLCGSLRLCSGLVNPGWRPMGESSQMESSVTSTCMAIKRGIGSPERSHPPISSCHRVWLRPWQSFVLSKPQSFSRWPSQVEQNASKKTHSLVPRAPERINAAQKQKLGQRWTGIGCMTHDRWAWRYWKQRSQKTCCRVDDIKGLSKRALDPT